MVTTSPPPTDQREAAPAQEAEPTRLSMTQIVASALAAVSTTVALSYFGVAGTIIGAGLASVLTVVANFLYTRSIEKTHAQLKPVVGQLKRPRPARPVPDGGTPAAQVASAGDRSTAATAAVDVELDEAAASEDDREDAPPRNRWLRAIRRHGTVKVLAASAGVVFVAVMGVVLAVELMIGKPLADAVHGQEGSGTSISRTVGSGSDSSGTGSSDGIDRGAGQYGGTSDSTGSQDGEQSEGSTGTGGSEDTEDAGDESQSTPDPEPTDPAAPEEPTEPTDPAEPEGPDEGDAGGTGDGSTEAPETDTGSGGAVEDSGSLGGSSSSTDTTD